MAKEMLRFFVKKGDVLIEHLEKKVIVHLPLRLLSDKFEINEFVLHCVPTIFPNIQITGNVCASLFLDNHVCFLNFSPATTPHLLAEAVDWAANGDFSKDKVEKTFYEDEVTVDQSQGDDQKDNQANACATRSINRVEAVRILKMSFWLNLGCFNTAKGYPCLTGLHGGTSAEELARMVEGGLCPESLSESLF